MRLNDRADETRYIDPVTEQERSSRFWLRQIGGHNAWRDSNGQLRTTSAQAIWMGVDHNVHTEANGSRIENDANNNIRPDLVSTPLFVLRRKTAVRTVTTLNLC